MKEWYKIDCKKIQDTILVTSDPLNYGYTQGDVQIALHGCVNGKRHGLSSTLKVACEHHGGSKLAQRASEGHDGP